MLDDFFSRWQQDIQPINKQEFASQSEIEQAIYEIFEKSEWVTSCIKIILISLSRPPHNPEASGLQLPFASNCCTLDLKYRGSLTRDLHPISSPRGINYPTGFMAMPGVHRELNPQY